MPRKKKLVAIKEKEKVPKAASADIVNELAELSQKHEQELRLFERTNIVTGHGLQDCTEEYNQIYEGYNAPHQSIKPMMATAIEDAQNTACILPQIKSSLQTSAGSSATNNASFSCVNHAQYYTDEMINQEKSNLIFQAIRQLFIDMDIALSSNPEVKEYIPSANAMFNKFIEKYKIDVRTDYSTYLHSWNTDLEIQEGLSISNIVNTQQAILKANLVANCVRNTVMQIIGESLPPSLYDNQFVLSLITYFDASGIFHTFHDTIVDILNHISQLVTSASIIHNDFLRYRNSDDDLYDDEW